MPISRRARATRIEISPRFAIRTFSNTAGEYCGKDGKPVLRRSAVVRARRTREPARMQWNARGGAIMFVAAFLLLTGTAAAAPPATPAITEPSTDGQLVHPEDVHMQATGYSDPDNDTQACTNWEIRTADQAAVVWHAVCATGLEATHIHLGDGSFVNGY